MPFNLVGGPEEASQQLIAHLVEKGILPSAEDAVAQRLDEVEKKLFESLQLIRQIRLQEERRKVDR